MRDINRIDIFLKEFGKLWKENCSDWRFMQIICNMQSGYDSDLFYLEEDRFLEYVKNYFKELKKYNG